ncbi:MAG TPA: ferrochelatase [Solirubrobacteraceae bacterium]|nr:ferrochelatase [Solirubrobacteraceae bacterium]
MSQPVGVLLLAYGTPASAAEIPAYYTHIRRGRPPTPELLQELTDRYAAIGGSSPLLGIARRQAAGLERMLGDRSPEHTVRVVLGMKHAAPFIEDAVAELSRAGVERTVAVVLAPHYSSLSVEEYLTRVRAAAQRHGLEHVGVVRQWHLEPGYVELLADRTRASLDRLRADGARRIRVLFTAHSLPSRILERGDPYPDQLMETAAAVAERAGIDDWSVAWQSAGRTADPWIGPDVCQVIRELGAARVWDGVLVCPAGFVSEHLEILYDLDIQAREVAAQAGLRFARTALPNADREFLAVLAEIVSANLPAPVR